MTLAPARILVVDDEDSILQFVSYNLKKEGYEVTCVKDGDAALRVADVEPFDLVILDIMPCRGWTATRCAANCAPRRACRCCS